MFPKQNSLSYKPIVGGRGAQLLSIIQEIWHNKNYCDEISMFETNKRKIFCKDLLIS